MFTQAQPVLCAAWISGFAELTLGLAASFTRFFDVRCTFTLVEGREVRTGAALFGRRINCDVSVVSADNVVSTYLILIEQCSMVSPMHRSPGRFFAIVAMMITSVALASQSLASAAIRPQFVNWPAAFAQSVVTPEALPVGTNDWTCRPNATHPRPVVLIHGTWENALSTWSGMAPALKNDGDCVFTLNFGRSNVLEQGGLASILPGAYGARPIDESAKEVAAFIDRVLAATGARQVDLVGHSQGGIVARQYLKFDGGANPTDPSQNKVRKLITIAATNHGTTLDGLGTLDRIIRDQARINLDPMLNYPVGVSGVQQIYDSPFLRRLNASGDTMPGIEYTAIASKYDEVSTPYFWTFLEAGPGATVRNITLQDGCHQDNSEHLSIDYSPRAIDWVRHTLTPDQLPAGKIRCVYNSPIFGYSEGV